MIAEKIKALREARGWTQAELARRMGITRNGVNSWEQGLSIPSPASIVELAKTFSVSTVKKPSLRGGIVTGIMILSIFCDWAVLAPVFTLLFVRAQDVWEEKRNAYIKAAILFGIVTFLGGMGRIPAGRNLFQVFAGMSGIALSGVVILGFYNGRQMRRGRIFSKWFFYVFYPLHLLVIGIIRVTA